MLLANFDRKEHLQHRAVSLRQHGFLVLCVCAFCVSKVGRYVSLTSLCIAVMMIDEGAWWCIFVACWLMRQIINCNATNSWTGGRYYWIIAHLWGMLWFYQNIDNERMESLPSVCDGPTHTQLADEAAAVLMPSLHYTD